MHTILLALVLALQGTTGHSIILSWVASTSAAMCLPTSTPACTLTYTVIEGTTPGGENPTPINTSPITTASYTIPVTMTSAPCNGADSNNGTSKTTGQWKAPRLKAILINSRLARRNQ